MFGLASAARRRKLPRALLLLLLLPASSPPIRARLPLNACGRVIVWPASFMTEVDGAVVLGSLLASVVINVRPSRRSSVPLCDITVYNGGGKWRMREKGWTS